MGFRGRKTVTGYRQTLRILYWKAYYNRHIYVYIVQLQLSLFFVGAHLEHGAVAGTDLLVFRTSVSGVEEFCLGAKESHQS